MQLACIEFVVSGWPMERGRGAGEWTGAGGGECGKAGAGCRSHGGKGQGGRGAGPGGIFGGGSRGGLTRVRLTAARPRACWHGEAVFISAGFGFDGFDSFLCMGGWVYGAI